MRCTPVSPKPDNYLHVKKIENWLVSEQPTEDKLASPLRITLLRTYQAFPE